MIVRKAGISDIPAIAGLSGELGYSPDERLMKARFHAVASDPSHCVFVAEDEEGSVLAWIHVLPRALLISGPVAEIGGLIVGEKHRKKGVGKKLIERAESWAFENGFKGVVVCSNTERMESHRFYPSVGYECKKTQRVYYKESTIKQKHSQPSR